MWVRVENGTIVAASAVEESGWMPVVEQPRPVDTLTGTWEPTLTLVDGVPTRSWQPRSWAPDELPEERREQLERDKVRAELRETVVTGLAALAAARTAAEADIATANSLRETSLSLAAATADLTAAIAAFTPEPYYDSTQLDQVKAALAQLASTQLALAHGLAEIYTYRRANDEVAILAHRSLEFLARVLFEVDP